MTEDRRKINRIYFSSLFFQEESELFFKNLKRVIEMRKRFSSILYGAEEQMYNCIVSKKLGVVTQRENIRLS